MNKSSAVTSRAALLVVALCSAGAAALAGLPLPAPYRAAQTVQAGKVAVTPAHATLRVPSGVEGQDTLREITLLLAREAGTGRTLWKRSVSGLARVQEVNGDRVTVSAPVAGGWHVTQFRLADGQPGSVWGMVKATPTR